VSTIVVGGPAYNLQSDVRHTQSILDLSAALEMHDQGHQVIGSAYEHDALLPFARERLLHRLMRTPNVDFFLSVDSDTYFDGRSMAAAMLDQQHGLPWVTYEAALYAALVPQRDGKVNAWRSEGVRLKKEDAYAEGKPRDAVQLHWVGLACVVYDLRWYREHRGKVSCWHGIQCDSSGEQVTCIGEDVYHCEVVRALGGDIVGWPSVQTYHAGRMTW
jgi:hypothetical protein